MKPNWPAPIFFSLGRGILAIFVIYRHNGRLGHPVILRRALELLPAAGFTEVRLCDLEWSSKALDLANPHELTDWPITTRRTLVDHGYIRC